MAADGLACIFSDCSYQPLYQEWLFTPPPNSSVFPFQVVSLQQLIAQNRVNVLWPQASIDAYQAYIKSINTGVVNKIQLRADTNAQEIVKLTNDEQQNRLNAISKNHFTAFKLYLMIPMNILVQETLYYPFKEINLQILQINI